MKFIHLILLIFKFNLWNFKCLFDFMKQFEQNIFFVFELNSQLKINCSYNLNLVNIQNLM